jgi:hypothetical protein
MNTNRDDFCPEYFARQWIEETTKFKELTAKRVEKVSGIWKPKSKWRLEHEKRKERGRKNVSNDNV